MDSTEFKRQNRLHAANTKAALAGGFLETVGSDKGYVQRSIVFDTLQAVLFEYSEKFVNRFKSELDKQGVNASGDLSSSIRFQYKKAGTVYETAIFMNDYAKFVDEGVQGVNSAKSINKTSPYKFKFAHPSATHIAALEKWIKEKNVTALITAPKGIISKDLSPKSLAYAIGTATKQRGLKATYFKKKVVESLITDLKRDIAAAIGEDIKVNILF